MALWLPALSLLFAFTGVLQGHVRGASLDTIDHLAPTLPSLVPRPHETPILPTSRKFCDSLKRLGHHGRQRSYMIKIGVNLTFCDNITVSNVHEKQQSHHLFVKATNPDDIEALKALYSSTNGKNWSRNDHWLQGDPCGNKWYGITCSPKGRVTHISMINNGLVGHLSPQISKASELVELTLSINKLKGEIPSEIYAMKSLQELSLDDNQFNGSLPEMISMPNLTKFFVFFNQLAGPLPKVWDTPNLVNLDVGHNQFSGPLPDAVGKLDRLQYLYIDYLKGVNGTVPESYGNLPSLTDISLAGDSLANFTIPQSWSQFSNLSYLQLSSLVGELPVWMGKSWPKLSILLIWGSNLSGGIPESVGHLSQLLSLDMYSLGLSGSVPESFSGLTQVSELNLSGNKLSSMPASLLKSLFMHIPLYFCNLSANPWSCLINSFFIDYCEAVCSECNSGERHTNETQCLSRIGCGWCEDGPNCLEGNATGPTGYTCSSWHFG